MPRVVNSLRPMGDHKFWCGVCEASCGLEATVDAGRLIEIRPDASHPNSTGFGCVKGTRWGDVLADPDRLTEPMRRRPDGSFAPVSWDEALDDIGRRERGDQALEVHGRQDSSVGVGAARYRPDRP